MCHFITFIVLVNSQQRWKETRNRVCFHLWLWLNWWTHNSVVAVRSLWSCCMFFHCLLCFQLCGVSGDGKTSWLSIKIQGLSTLSKVKLLDLFGHPSCPAWPESFWYNVKDHCKTLLSPYKISNGFPLQCLYSAQQQTLDFRLLLQKCLMAVLPDQKVFDCIYQTTLICWYKRTL